MERNKRKNKKAPEAPAQSSSNEQAIATYSMDSQYEDSDVYELVSSHEINSKLTVHVYTCLAHDGRVFGLRQLYFPDEILITEATFKKLAEELHL